MVYGEPEGIDFTVKNSVNGIDTVLNLDFGAELSVISSDFVKETDRIVSYRSVKGIDDISCHVHHTVFVSLHQV